MSLRVSVLSDTIAHSFLASELLVSALFLLSSNACAGPSSHLTFHTLVLAAFLLNALLFLLFTQADQFPRYDNNKSHVLSARHFAHVMSNSYSN